MDQERLKIRYDNAELLREKWREKGVDRYLSIPENPVKIINGRYIHQSEIDMMEMMFS